MSVNQRLNDSQIDGHRVGLVDLWTFFVLQRWKALLYKMSSINCKYNKRNILFIYCLHYIFIFERSIDLVHSMNKTLISLKVVMMWNRSSVSLSSSSILQSIHVRPRPNHKLRFQALVTFLCCLITLVTTTCYGSHMELWLHTSPCAMAVCFVAWLTQSVLSLAYQCPATASPATISHGAVQAPYMGCCLLTQCGWAVWMQRDGLFGF